MSATKMMWVALGCKPIEMSLRRFTDELAIETMARSHIWVHSLEGCRAQQFKYNAVFGSASTVRHTPCVIVDFLVEIH